MRMDAWMGWKDRKWENSDIKNLMQLERKQIKVESIKIKKPSILHHIVMGTYFSVNLKKGEDGKHYHVYFP